MGGRAAHRKRRVKQTAEPNVTKEQVLRYIQSDQSRSAGIQAILEEYEATPQVRRQIKDILTQLVKEGRLERHKGSRYQVPARSRIEGTILLHRDGYGFVIPKEKVQGIESDIFIPSALVGSAMNGDKVEVEIT